MIGEIYLERGEPVRVLAQWREGSRARPEEVDQAAADMLVEWIECGHIPRRRLGPRNVLIERVDGTLVIRPFRGLRRPK